MREKNIYSWQTKEFADFEKTPAWYGNIAVVFLGMAALFIFYFHQYLPAVVVIVGLLALYAHASQEPKKIKCQITDKKVRIGYKKYSYQKLKSFWVVDRGQLHKLYFHTTALLFPIISIPLGGGKAKKIKKALSNYLPQTQTGETVNDKISRWLGF